MDVKGFSIGEVLRFGWNKLKENWFFLLSYLVLVNIICAGGYLFGLPIGQSAPKTWILVQIFLFVLNMTFGMGLIKANLTIADGEKPSWSYIYSQFPLLFKYFFGALLYVIVVLLGLILFIVPGLVWGVKYLLFSYAVVDKKFGPIEALEESSRITNGAKWDIAGWGLLSTALMYVAVLVVLLVPALTAMLAFNISPEALLTTQAWLGLIIISCFVAFLALFSLFVSLMMAYIYRKLERQSGNE
jgi:hypothetical protein